LDVMGLPEFESGSRGPKPRRMDQRSPEGTPPGSYPTAPRVTYRASTTLRFRPIRHVALSGATTWIRNF
jgi:hypothetical protein